MLSEPLAKFVGAERMGRSQVGPSQGSEAGHLDAVQPLCAWFEAPLRALLGRAVDAMWPLGQAVDTRWIQVGLMW